MAARLDPLVALDRAQSVASVIISRLGPDDWDRPTPCDEWSVRDEINKMVASTLMFTAFGRKQRMEPPLDLVHPPEMIGDDPLGVFLAAAIECRTVWRAPEALEGDAPSTVGMFPALAVLNARIFDTTILSHDVAAATGQPHGIDDDLARYVHHVARRLVSTVRAKSPDRYKDPASVDAPDDASPVEQMIAATGRDPAWTPPEMTSVS